MADTTSTAEKAERAKKEASQVAEQGKQEAKTMAEQTKESLQQGVETLKERKRPLDAALSVPEKAPSPLFLGLAAGSILFSLLLYGFRKREDAIFVGQWAPTFLALGLFAKLITRTERR